MLFLLLLRRVAELCDPITLADGTALGCAVAVAIGSGCRRGELLPLRWCDVDLDAGTLRVARSLERVTIKTTKRSRCAFTATSGNTEAAVSLLMCARRRIIGDMGEPKKRASTSGTRKGKGAGCGGPEKGAGLWGPANGMGWGGESRASGQSQTRCMTTEERAGLRHEMTELYLAIARDPAQPAMLRIQAARRLLEGSKTLSSICTFESRIRGIFLKPKARAPVRTRGVAGHLAAQS